MSIVPTGARLDFASVGTITTAKMQCELTPSGSLFGLRVKDSSTGAWQLVSTPANYAPHSAVVDFGACLCVGACVSDIESERRFVHQAGSYPVAGSGTWLPRQHVCEHEPLSELTAGQWTSRSLCYDSIMHSAYPPLLDWTTAITATEQSGTSRLSVSSTIYRTEAVSRWVFRWWNVPSLTLDPNQFHAISLDNGATLTPIANVPRSGEPGAELTAAPTCKAVWLQTKFGRWVVLRWDSDGLSFRCYRHPASPAAAAVLVVTPIITNMPCTPGAGVNFRYTIEAA